MIAIFTKMAGEFWHILQESAFYILIGITLAGILRIFLNPSTVLTHLGNGRFRSVFKAAVLGVPLPL